MIELVVVLVCLVVASNFKNMKVAFTLVLLVHAINLTQMVVQIEIQMPRAGYLLSFPNLATKVNSQLILHALLYLAVISTPKLSFVSSLLWSCQVLYVVKVNQRAPNAADFPGDLIDSGEPIVTIAVLVGGLFVLATLVSMRLAYLENCRFYYKHVSEATLDSLNKLIENSQDGIFVVREAAKPSKSAAPVAKQ